MVNLLAVGRVIHMWKFTGEFGDDLHIVKSLLCLDEQVCLNKTTTTAATAASTAAAATTTLASYTTATANTTLLSYILLLIIAEVFVAYVFIIFIKILDRSRATRCVFAPQVDKGVHCTECTEFQALRLLNGKCKYFLLPLL